VFCYTNFSPARKEPLKRDARISDSEEQIVEMAKNYINASIKKGWNKL